MSWLGEVTATSKDSILNAALVPRHYPTGDGAETAVEFVADPSKIHAAFGADLLSARCCTICSRNPIFDEVHVTEIDRDHQHFQNRPPVGPASVRTSFCRKMNPVCHDVVRSQLRRAKTTRDIHVVVVTPEHQIVFSEEEILDEAVGLN
ncbi:MAG: hypothetical protein JO057_20620 [Chloroflexi bacterium]|nr:hypothetical protein [Chloroflexota bacterium]